MEARVPDSGALSLAIFRMENFDVGGGGGRVPGVAACKQAKIIA